MRDDWWCYLKSGRALCHSFGHIFHFFGICFAHAVSLNCLLHALAFWILIQCIIDAHLAAKIQVLCVPRCLHTASRDVPHNLLGPVRDGGVAGHTGAGWPWHRSLQLLGQFRHMGGTRASQVSQRSPSRSRSLWPQVWLERKPCSCFCAAMHFVLVIIRNRNVKSRHDLPLIS